MNWIGADEERNVKNDSRVLANINGERQVPLAKTDTGRGLTSLE